MGFPDGLQIKPFLTYNILHLLKKTYTNNGVSGGLK